MLRSGAQLLLLIILVAHHQLREVETLEPVSTTIAVGTAILGSAAIASYDTVKCYFKECCDESWIMPNFTGLILISMLQKKLSSYYQNLRIKIQ